MQTTDQVKTAGVIGKHEYYFEEDTVYIRFQQNVNLTDTKQFVELFDIAYKRYNRLFLISDVSQSSLIEPEARKFFVNWAQKLQNFSAATVGAGMIQRTLVLFMANAIKLLSGKSLPYVFCNDEATARVWIAKQRAAIMGMSAKP